jgi:hypothetical protein
MKAGLIAIFTLITFATFAQDTTRNNPNAMAYTFATLWKAIRVQGVKEGAKVKISDKTDSRGGDGEIVDTTDGFHPDGGTIISIPQTKYAWARDMSQTQAINAKWFGAKGDSITDDGANLQKAIYSAIANNRELYIPAGDYRTATTLFVTGALSIHGDGAATTKKRGITRILTNRNTSDLFNFLNTGAKVRIDNISFENTGSSTPVAGCIGLNFQNANSVTLENISVIGFYDNVNFTSGEYYAMDKCYIFDPVRYGVRIRNILAADVGDMTITNSVFLISYFNTRAPAAAIHWESGGGLRFNNNKINWSGSAQWVNPIEIEPANHAVTSVMNINNNSIENASGNAVYIHNTTSDTFTLSKVAILGNEFGLIGGSAIKIDVDSAANGTKKIHHITISSDYIAGTYGLDINNVDNVEYGISTIATGTTLIKQTNSTNIHTYVFNSKSDVNHTNMVAFWGDSYTAGSYSTSSFPGEYGLYSGMNVYNGGVGGETSDQIRARFIADTAKYRYPTVIWSGRNNFQDTTQVKSDIAAMVAALQSVGNNNYIVLSVFNSNLSGATEWVGGNQYNIITKLNNYLSQTYGKHYLDLHAYIVSQYDATIPQDVIDFGHDVAPKSLRADSLHLNKKGYRLAARYLYDQTIKYLDTTSERILSVQSARGLLQNMPSLNLADSGLITIGGLQAVYMPNQGATNGSIVFGDGGRWLRNTGGGITGRNNTFVGINAGYTDSLGKNNTFVGFRSGYINNGAANNTGVGMESLRFNRTGNDNTAMGYQSMWFNSTGAFNTAFGSQTLFNNSTGTNNTAGGYQSMVFNTTGGANTAWGVTSLWANTTGISNTAIGYNSLHSNTVGGNNTSVGSGTMSDNTTGDLNTAVGAGALGHNLTGGQNTATGGQALGNNLTGGFNTADGYQSLFSNTNGANNYAGGFQSMLTNTSGGASVALGYRALYGNTTGGSNVAAGYQALMANDTGFSNTGFGTNVLRYSRYGNYNVALGEGGLFYNLDGNNNVALGYRAALSNTHGNGNIAIGTDALYGSGDSATASGNYNIAIGNKALLNYATGADSNIVIGNNSGNNPTAVSGKGKILIGNNINFQSMTANNTLIIANSIFGTGMDGRGQLVSTGKIGMFNTNPISRFDVTGTGRFSDTLYAANGVLPLATNSKELGSSTLQWNAVNAITFKSNTALAVQSAGTGLALQLKQGNTVEAQIAATTSNFVIGANAADVSTAQLSVTSTTKGFLAPRMTTAQRTAISSPADGLMVYDTDLHTQMNYNGTRWVQSNTIYMTTALRTAYTAWIGMRIYDTDLNHEYVWDGTIWQATW